MCAKETPRLIIIIRARLVQSVIVRNRPLKISYSFTFRTRAVTARKCLHVAAHHTHPFYTDALWCRGLFYNESL